MIAGRSDKAPLSVHRKPLVSNPYLTPSSQSTISYANSQKLGFAEWDRVREGWIAYTIHLPEGWRDSVNVVKDRLIMPSKRGKGSKREAPVDQAVEKTSKKPVPFIPSSKKAPFKKTTVGKKSESPLVVSSVARVSTTGLVEEPIESAVVPPKKKTKAGKESRSTPSVPSAVKESTAVHMEEPAKSTVAPSKKIRAGKEGKSIPSMLSVAKESTTAAMEEPAESTAALSKLKSVSASPSKKPSKKSAASRPPKG